MAKESTRTTTNNTTDNRRKVSGTNKRITDTITDVEEYNQFSKQIGALFTLERKLIRKKKGLLPFNNPILVLQRSNGRIELHHNVKEKEWMVPGLPAGTEKKIILGREYQTEFPYAGKTIKMYWCHEDWLFPHVWSRPTEYQGKKEEAPNKGWILEQANINSEAFRDRERKVLIAWERFTATANEKNIMAWAKFILYGAGALALLWWVYNMFSTGNGTTAAPAVTTIINGSTGMIIG